MRNMSPSGLVMVGRSALLMTVTSRMTRANMMVDAMMTPSASAGVRRFLFLLAMESDDVTAVLETRPPRSEVMPMPLSGPMNRMRM